MYVRPLEGPRLQGTSKGEQSPMPHLDCTFRKTRTMASFSRTVKKSLPLVWRKEGMAGKKLFTSADGGDCSRRGSAGKNNKGGDYKQARAPFACSQGTLLMLSIFTLLGPSRRSVLPPLPLYPLLTKIKALTVT